MALISAAIFILDVPTRIAELGSGNLERIVAPTTTVPFGKSVELAGRAERPPVWVAASDPMRVHSATRGVRPAKGATFVGVPLMVRNLGNVPFLTSMGVEVSATDERGGEYRLAGGLIKLRGQRMLDVTRMRPNAVRRGVVVFELPRGRTLSSVRFTVGSGLVRTAEWTRESVGN